MSICFENPLVILSSSKFINHIVFIIYFCYDLLENSTISILKNYFKKNYVIFIIYKVFLIDADDGILLLEATFKNLKNILSIDRNIQAEIITGFFNAINRTIDNIQEAMAKGRRINEMTRVLASEESVIIIYYHPLSRVLFCSISDADDDTDKIKEVVNKIGNRFWKKHQSDFNYWRTTTEKKRFQTFITEVENLTLGGRIAEVFPKVLIVKSVLEKILSMGLINELGLKVAMKCDGETSPLSISRYFDKSRTEINEILRKLEELNIIRI